MRRLRQLILATGTAIGLVFVGIAGAGAIGVAPSLIGGSQPTPIPYVRPAGVTSATGLVPITPCRILDTRNASGGALAVGTDRAVQVSGTTGFSAQGGGSGGCGVPSEATAVAVSLSAVAPKGAGYLRAWPHGAAAPTATVLNWLGATNGGVTTGSTLAIGNQKIDVRAFGSTTHLVIDVTGYFVEPIVAKVGFQGDLQSWSTGIVFADRASTGTYVLQAARPVGSCAASATPFDTGSQAVAYTQGSLVYVVITDAETGADADANFTVSVIC